MKQKILVLAPHTDDGEFGCGGAISRFVEQGADIYYVAFSTAGASVPKGMPKNILEIEVREATARLGILPENLYVFDYEVRKLNFSRQDILEDLVKLKQDIAPDLVFLPSENDIHQDHYTVTMEGIRAFKQTSILGYELPWNMITFRTQSFIKLEERFIQKKIFAIQAYKSQQQKSYASEKFIESLAVTRGTQIGCEYAEAFEVIRWVM